MKIKTDQTFFNIIHIYILEYNRQYAGKETKKRKIKDTYLAEYNM